MNRRQVLVLALGVALVIAISPGLALAQGTTTTTTGSTFGTSGISGISGLSGLGGGNIGTSAGQGSNSSSTAQSLKIVTPSSGTGSSTGAPASSNFMVSSYGDPYSMGLPTIFSKGPPNRSSDASVKVTFGTANYANTGKSAGQGGAASTTSTATNYGTSVGVVRNPQYVTVLSDNLPIVIHQTSALQSEVRDVIARSERLPSKNDIQVSVNGNTVILSGRVGSDRERLVAEGIAKMTPGVRDVQNQLQVK